MNRTSPGAIYQTANLVFDVGCSLKEGVKAFERALIISALERHDGNMCRAAQGLKVHRNTICRYVEQFHLWKQVSEMRQRHRKSVLQMRSIHRDAQVSRKECTA